MKIRYNPIDRKKIREVKIVDFNDEEYKRWWEDIKGKQKGEKGEKVIERRKFIKEHKKGFDLFEEYYNKFDYEKIEKFLREVDDCKCSELKKISCCGVCEHSGKDRYSSSENDLCCWFERSGRRPLKRKYKSKVCGGFKVNEWKVKEEYIREIRGVEIDITSSPPLDFLLIMKILS